MPSFRSDARTLSQARTPSRRQPALRHTQTWKFPLSALLLASASLAAGKARAGTSYFTADGATAPWDTTTANWSDTSGGPYATTWTNGNDAVIEGAAGTVNIGAGGVTAHGIDLSSVAGNTTLTGGTLTLNGGYITAAAGTTVTLGAPVAGELRVVGLDTIPPAVFILTANNTYTTTTVNNNSSQRLSTTVLVIGNGGTTGTLGSGAVTLMTRTGLAYNRTDDTVISNTITSTFGGVETTYLGNISSGTLTLTGDQSGFKGTYIPSAGAMVFDGAAALSASARIRFFRIDPARNSVLSGGTGVIGLGAGNSHFTWALGQSSRQVAFFGGSSGGFAAYGTDATVNLGGAGDTLAWNSTPDFLRTGTSLILGATSADATVDFQNALALNGAQRTLQVNDGSAAVDGVLSGGLTGNATSGLRKTGTGTLALTHDSNYGGETRISGGTLNIANGAAAGSLTSGAVTVDAGSTLQVGPDTGAGSLTANGLVSNAGTLNVGDGLGTALNAVMTANAGLTNTGTLTVTGVDGALSVAGTTTNAAGATLTNNGGDVGLAAVDNAGNIAHNDGSLTASGLVTNRAGAALTIGDGIGDALTATATFNNGLANNGTLTVTGVDGALSVAGTTTNAAGATLTNNGGNVGLDTLDNAGNIAHNDGSLTASGLVTNRAGATLTIGDGIGDTLTATTTLHNGLINNGTVTINGIDGGVTVTGGLVSGTGTIAGSGVLTIGPNATITGGDLGTGGQLGNGSDKPNPNGIGTQTISASTVNLHGTYVFDVDYGALGVQDETGDLLQFAGGDIDMTGAVFQIGQEFGHTVAGEHYAIKIFDASTLSGSIKGAPPTFALSPEAVARGESVVTWDGGKTYYLVPEPASFALLCAGGLLVMLRRPSGRRRRTMPAA